MRLTMILVAIALTGCATSEVVYLKNMGGQTVQCGPYELAGIGGLQQAAAQAQDRLRDCVTDYQRQGYNRIPAP